MATIDIRGASLSAADPPIGTNPNADLAIKAPVRVATTGSNINLATIGLGTIDGVALAAGDRVLVKDQTDATTNGIYNAATGPWTRTIDANNNSQWSQGMLVIVTQGATNANTIFELTAANPITLGASALTFTSIKGNVVGAASSTAGHVATFADSTGKLIQDGTSGTIVSAAIGAVSTDGFVLTNAAAALVNAQQWSPRIRLSGQGWKTNATAASQEVDWIAEVKPVQGAANPTANLVFSSQVNGAGYTAEVTFTSGGQVGINNAAPSRTLDVTVGSTASTANQIRVQGYQASFEAMNQAQNANGYFGIDDADSNKLKIGTGSSAGQGLAPAIVVDVSNGSQVNIGNATIHTANLQAAFNVMADPNWGNSDFVASFIRNDTGSVGAGSYVTIAHYSGTHGCQPSLLFRGARGTLAAPAAVQTNDVMCTIDPQTYDGSIFFDQAAGINMVATQNWTASAHGAEILIFTTPKNASSRVTVMTINDDGGITIGAPTGGSKGAGTINVASGVYLNGTAYTNP